VQTGHVDVEGILFGTWRGINHREIFTTYLISECQNFQNLDDKCKLIWILNNEDPTIRSEISIIVVQAHSGRKRDICTLTNISGDSSPICKSIEHEKENILFGIVP
jgi:hypothetical protein